MKKQNVVNLSDGAYENAMTGLGIPGIDKNEDTRVSLSVNEPNYISLASQYAKDGIVGRLVDIPPLKALKSPITIVGDDEGTSFKELSSIGFFDSVTLAGKYARLFGGAILITLYDDGGQLETAVPKNARVIGYRVFSPYRTPITMADISSDPASPFFNDVAMWNVDLRSGKRIRVHPSRVTLFKGNALCDPLDVSVRAQIFGISEIERVNESIKKLAPAFGGLASMLQENGICVFSLAGMNSLLASPDNGANKINTRMSIVKRCMSSFRAVVQDTQDDFKQLALNFSGVPESIKILMSYVASQSGFPVSVLFGSTASGLSQTNEGDIRQLDDLVDQWRSAVLYAPMCSLISDYRTRNDGARQKSEFDFGAVSQMTVKEEADLMTARVTAANTLYEMGAVTSDEVRTAFVVNGASGSFSVEK